MHQLPIFEQWVGDGERFSARLWWECNSLKHNSSHEIDYRLDFVLGYTARTMLIGSLLDCVAGTRCVASGSQTTSGSSAMPRRNCWTSRAGATYQRILTSGESGRARSGRQTSQ